MARNDPQVNLRIPADIKAALDASAVENNRSLTAEIVDRLQESLLYRDVSDATADRLDAEHRALRAEMAAARMEMSQLETVVSLYQEMARRQEEAGDTVSPETLLRLQQAIAAKRERYGEFKRLSEMRARIEAATSAAHAERVRRGIKRDYSTSSFFGDAQGAGTPSASTNAEDDVDQSLQTMVVGHLGNGGESLYEKVIRRAEPELPKKPNNKGPSRSPNTRKPKT